MTKPTLADLRAFVSVGELKSFVAAAKLLHLSQPALSRRISHLEEILDVRLFDRTSRSVQLTALGQRFLVQVQHAIDDIDRSVVSLQDVAHLEAGDVTVGCVFSVVQHFLPSVMRIFSQRHPHVLIRIIEEGAEEVLASVKNGAADFALGYTGMQDPDVQFTVLFKEVFLLACPTNHPLAERKSVCWSELSQHPYALVSHESGNRVLIDQALAHVRGLSRPVCEVRHISTLIGVVESGLAIAVVPELALPRESGSIRGIRLEQPEISRTIGLIQRSNRTLSPAAAKFSQLLMEAGQCDVNRSGFRGFSRAHGGG